MLRDITDMKDETGKARSTRPTICYLTRGMLAPPAEGFHVFSKNVIEAVKNSGNARAQVLSLESPSAAREVSRDLTFLSARLNSRKLPSVFSTVDDFLSSASMASYVRSSDCDLVHVLNITKEPYAVVHNMLRVRKPLLIHFFHSPQVLGDDVFFLRNLAFRAGLYGRLHGNYVLTSNLAMLRFLVEKLGANHESVHYTQCPIDTDKFKPARNKDELREKYGIPCGSPVIVYVGSLQPARGLDVLLDAFKRITERFHNVLLLVCHPQRREERIFERMLYQQIQHLKLRRNVIIQGLVREIVDIYNIADVIVLPLIRPYWVDPPLVLLESLSSGATVVTTPVGAISEVVSDHENAVLVKAGDAEVLASAVAELLEKPDEARRIGQRAREMAVRRHSYEIVAKQLVRIYNSILDHQD